MAETENIIIRENLDGLGTDAYGNYLAHALCLAGFPGKGDIRDLRVCRAFNATQQLWDERPAGPVP